MITANDQMVTIEQLPAVLKERLERAREKIVILRGDRKVMLGQAVNILDVLRRSPVEVCQCELVPLFAMPQSTLSHHLKKLVDAGLVVVERRHRWAYYSLSPHALEELTAWLS